MSQHSDRASTIGRAIIRDTTRTSPRRNVVLASSWGAALLALLLYSALTPGQFTYDDLVVILDDTRLDDPAFIAQIPLAPWRREADNTSVSRPFTTLTFYLQTQLHGKHPTAFRAVNLLLFALLCIQVTALTNRLTGRLAPALIAGLLFAAHPIHVEIVPSVVGRAETLAALFALAALLHYLKHRSNLTAPHLALIGTFILLAGLSKEHGYLIAPIILLFELAARRIAGAPLLRPIPSGLIVALAVVAALAVSQRIAYRAQLESAPPPTAAINNPLVESGPAERIVTPLKLLGKATQLLVTPRNLSPDYSPRLLLPTASLADPLVILGLTAVTLYLPALALAWLRRSPALAPLLALPVAWFIPSNSLMLIGTIFGERLLTMLSIFASVAVAAIIPLDRIPPRARPLGALLLAAVVIALSAQTVRYAAFWESDPILVAYTAQTHPRSARFRAYFARDLMLASDHAPDPTTRRNLLVTAEQHAIASIELWPRHAFPYEVLGLIAEHTDRPDRAVAMYRLALSVYDRSQAASAGLERLRRSHPDLFLAPPRN